MSSGLPSTLKSPTSILTPVIRPVSYLENSIRPADVSARAVLLPSDSTVSSSGCDGLICHVYLPDLTLTARSVSLKVTLRCCPSMTQSRPSCRTEIVSLDRKSLGVISAPSTGVSVSERSEDPETPSAALPAECPLRCLSKKATTTGRRSSGSGLWAHVCRSNVWPILSMTISLCSTPASVSFVSSSCD